MGFGYAQNNEDITPIPLHRTVIITTGDEVISIFKEGDKLDYMGNMYLIKKISLYQKDNVAVVIAEKC